MVEQVLNIAASPGEEIVDAKNLMTLAEQPATKMCSKKSGATREQNPLAPIRPMKFRLTKCSAGRRLAWRDNSRSADMIN